MADDVNMSDAVALGGDNESKILAAIMEKPAAPEKPVAKPSGVNGVNGAASPTTAKAGAEDVAGRVAEGDDTPADETNIQEEVKEGDEAPEEKPEVEEPPDEDNLDEYLVEVVVDGKTVDVPLKDLKKSYSGNEFIEKNIQQAVEVRKEVETQAYALYDANKQTVEKLQRLDSILNTYTQPDIDWQKLKTTDPQAYVLKREEVREAQEKQTLVQQELNKVNQQQAWLEGQAKQKYLTEQAYALAEKVPDLRDPEKAKVVMGRLEKAAGVYGYTPEEMAMVMDHRALLVLKDAAEMQEIRAARAKIKEPGLKPPEQKKVLMRPKAGTATTQSSRRLETELRNRAIKSGKPEDVAATLLVRKG
jgi:hypothetical protein